MKVSDINKKTVMSVDYDNGFISNKCKVLPQNTWALSSRCDEEVKITVIEDDCKGYGEFSTLVKCESRSATEYFLVA